MKKILVALLLLTTVIGMTVPAMANPENAPIAAAKNAANMLVNENGANTATSSVGQALSNTGNQDNAATGIAIGGNAQADSQNIGVADAGASATDVSGKPDAEAFDNSASNTQCSYASASGGSPEGFSAPVYQINAVVQVATATLDTTQNLDQGVTIVDDQSATATDPASQTIDDSLLQEDGWTKTLNTNINP